MIMLALYSVLLARLSGQEEVVVGVPGAGRTRADWQPLIGIFINTMALPTFPHGEQTFSAFLDAVRQTSLEAFDNQDYPFEDLVEQLGLRRDAGRNPLFDVMFNFRKPGLPEKRLPGLRLRPVEYRGGISKFDLTLDAGESTDTVALTWEYSTDLFRRRTVERWTAYYRRLLTAVTKAPEQRLSALEILLPQERKQILEVWNNTAAAYPQEQTIADLLAVPVRRQMYRVALVGAKGHWLLTYGEFDRRAGHLALLLRRRGAGAERPVGIAAVVSPDLVVGLSAVVRSGAPFVPIDPAFPPDRIRCILADSGASIVLTDQADRLPPSFGGHSLSIITGMQAAGDMTRDGEAKGDGGSSPSALAYIIYISGSTGSPKGVMVEHRSLTNQIFGLMQMFPFDHTLHHILLAPITFDPSVQQIFLPLTSGGKLFLVPTELRQDASSLYDFIVSRQMDLVNTVPSLMEAIVRCAGGQPRRRLKYVILAGESFGRDLYLRLNERFTVDTLINIYGPAEATINTTLYRCAPGERGLSIPIGKPLPNYWVWITDACTNLLPPGLVGEMSISGQGLARGYLNQPELTAEKFVTVPAAGCQPPAAKLYRTGDLGRFLPDGNLEFCGRIDHQVKIRGMRVEPAEIEERLRAHPAVQEAVVTVVRLRAEDKYLCAYYVPEASRLPELWPSIGEYFVWDDLLYHAMSLDERRNRSFRQAIERAVKDRVVLDVGTGRDAILARFCAQAGAGKVYAVEVLEEFAGRAAQTVNASGLTGQISVIHGDIRDVTLPEKVDVCVSQLIGALGSAEGTIPLVNSAFRFLKPGGRMIPRRCVTRIAAAALPEALLQSPGFTEVSVQYVEKIFAKIGRPFDLRLCVKHFPPSHILSDSGIFEDLDFSFKMESGGATDVHLTIRRRGTVHGLLLWLNLYTGEDEMIDTLHNAHSWLPLFVPLFYPGLEMTEGDYIAARCLRTCGPNGLTPDYRISGSLNRKGQDPLKFDYSLPYDQQAYRRTPFYRQILTDGCGRVGTRDDGRGQPGAAELKTFLKRRLPDYMIPGHFVPLERLPLTRHGKIDLEALPQPAALTSDSALAPPRGSG